MSFSVEQSIADMGKSQLRHKENLLRALYGAGLANNCSFAWPFHNQTRIIRWVAIHSFEKLANFFLELPLILQQLINMDEVYLAHSLPHK